MQKSLTLTRAADAFAPSSEIGSLCLTIRGDLILLRDLTPDHAHDAETWMALRNAEQALVIAARELLAAKRAAERTEERRID